MAKIYEVILHVAEETLSPLIGAVAPQCTIVQVKPFEASSPAPPPRKEVRYANGVRFKGISGVDLALEVLATQKRPFTNLELSAAFKERGFKPNSVSPILARLVKEKKIKHVAMGKYELK